jgi:ribosomal protein L37E
MVVVVKCKKCGQEFPSKLVQSVNEQGLKNFTFQNNNEICLSCGQPSSYSVNDYFWKL